VGDTQLKTSGPSKAIRVFRRDRRRVSRLVLAACLCTESESLQAQTDAPLKGLARMRTLLSEAESLQHQGRMPEALALATEAIRAAPEAADPWMLRGRWRAASGDFKGAAGDFAKVIELQPSQPDARMQRALARFSQGRIAKSLEDFDRLAELVPKQAPQLWQRGVALSLAGRHEDACRQFRAHYHINSNDVEVAAWHFLSNAKVDGAEMSRTNLLVVHGDLRVPMREIFNLYSGTGSVEEVLAAADSSHQTNAGRHLAHFYARLYLAIYLDACGKEADALPHAREAAANSASYGFLGQAARLYAEQLNTRKASKSAPLPAIPGGMPDEVSQP
jgi:lipoprotein NlpI